MGSVTVGRASCSANFQFHQSLGSKTDHVAQNIRVRGLIHELA